MLGWLSWSTSIRECWVQPKCPQTMEQNDDSLKYEFGNNQSAHYITGYNKDYKKSWLSHVHIGDKDDFNKNKINICKMCLIWGLGTVETWLLQRHSWAAGMSGPMRHCCNSQTNAEIWYERQHESLSGLCGNVHDLSILIVERYCY